MRTLPDEAAPYFPRTARGGDEAPSRVIAGAATAMNGPSHFQFFPRRVFADGFEGEVAFEFWSAVVP